MKIFYLARINVATEDASTRHVFEFCRAMAQVGHDVVLFVPDLGRKRKLDGVELEYVPVGLTQSWFTYFSFYLVLAVVLGCRSFSDKPDIIYTRHQPMEWLATWIKGWIKCRYVIEVNGLAPVELKINKKPGWWISCVRLLENFNFKMADRLVVPSRLIRDALVRHYRLKQGSILVVTNGANPEVSRPLDKLSCRKELGFPEDEKFLVFVGSLKQWHGIGELLQLMPELTRRIPDLHLIVVGEGGRRRELQEWVDQAGMSPSIHFTGRVPFEKVPLYINAGDICVAPYFEAGLRDTGISPLKIYEYMACARPIICNPLGGLEDLFQDYEIGVSIDSMDPKAWIEPIEKLISDPERMRVLGENGYRAVKQDFSWQAICKKIAGSIEDLVART